MSVWSRAVYRRVDSNPPAQQLLRPWSGRDTDSLPHKGRDQTQLLGGRPRFALDFSPEISLQQLGSGPSEKSRPRGHLDRKSTRLNSSHITISYAVFCLKKKKKHPLSTPAQKKQNKYTTHEPN